jgi:hypothetical protein
MQKHTKTRFYNKKPCTDATVGSERQTCRSVKHEPGSCSLRTAKCMGVLPLLVFTVESAPCPNNQEITRVQRNQHAVCNMVEPVLVMR